MRKAAELDRKAQRIKGLRAAFVAANPELAWMDDATAAAERTSNGFVLDSTVPPRLTEGVESKVSRLWWPDPDERRRSMLTPEERSQRARLAAYTRWSKQDPVEGTQKARDAFHASFIEQVDPDRVFPEPERLRRANAARSAYYARLAYKSAKARRERRES